MDEHTMWKSLYENSIGSSSEPKEPKEFCCEESRNGCPCTCKMADAAEKSDIKMTGWLGPETLRNFLGDLTKPEPTGPKTTAGKPDWSILPMDAVEFLIPAFEHGKKPEVYGEKNTFREGILFGKLIAATIRHLVKWYWLKEELAPDSSVHHLAHAGANILMIICNLGKENCDDR